VLTEQAPTDADKRTLREQSAVEERRQDQEITVTFTEPSEHATDTDDHRERDDGA
jgi:hypothetical protein